MGSIVPVYFDGAMIWTEKTDNHFDESCFPGTIGSDKRENFSWLHRKTDIIDSYFVTETFGEVVESEHSFLQERKVDTLHSIKESGQEEM